MRKTGTDLSKKKSSTMKIVKKPVREDKHVRQTESKVTPTSASCTTHPCTATFPMLKGIMELCYSTHK